MAAITQPVPKLEVAWNATRTSAEEADTFNRANSSTSLGVTSFSGQAWNPQIEKWGITSNRAYCPDFTAQQKTSGAAYCDWTLPTPADPGFDTLQVGMYPLRDASPAGLYWAQQFEFFDRSAGGGGCYTGLLTRGAGFQNQRQFLCSMGGAVDFKNGSGFGSFFAEGTWNGYSLGMPYEWTLNHNYLIQISYQTTAPAGKTNGSGHWWKVDINDLTTGGSLNVGYLQMPDVYKRLKTASTCFAEHYSGYNTDRTPYSSVVIGKPLMFVGATPFLATGFNLHVAHNGVLDTSRSTIVNEPIVGAKLETGVPFQSVGAGFALATVDACSSGTIGVNLMNLFNEQGLVFRCKDSNNFWVIQSNSNFASYDLMKRVNGLQTLVSRYTAVAPVPGDLVKVVLNGSSISVYVNNNLRISTTDTTLQFANKAGLYEHPGSGGGQWDNFFATMDWTDETQRIRRGQGIHTHRGRQREIDVVEAGVMDLTFDNLDNALSHNNTGSKYYPNVEPRRPTRLTATLSSRNLAVNSSFERALSSVLADGWFGYNNGPEAATWLVLQDPYTGLNSQRVSWTSTNTSTKGIYQQRADFDPSLVWENGKDYVISWYSKGTAATTMQLAWNNGPTVTNIISNPVLHPTIWQRYAFNVRWNIGQTVESVGRFYLTISYATGAASRNVFFDAIQVEEATYPSDWVGDLYDLGATSHSYNFPVFRGAIEGFPINFTLEDDSYVPITVSDAFRYFSNAEVPPPYETEIKIDSPFVWYRLGEETESTTVMKNYARDFSDPLSVPDASKDGIHNVTVGCEDTLIFGDPHSGSSSYTGSLPCFSTIPAVGVPDWATLAIEFWFQCEPRDINNYLFSCAGSDGQHSFYIDTNGFLAQEKAGGLGGIVFLVGGPLCTDTATGQRLYLADNKPHHVILYHSPTSATRFQSYIDGRPQTQTFGSGGGLPGQNIPIYIGYRPAYGGVSVDRTFKGNIDEFAIYQNNVFPADRALAHYNAGSMPWDGDSPGRRVTRMLDGIGWSTAMRSLDTGSSVLGPADFSNAPKTLDLIHLITDTERGPIFIDRFGRVRLIGRSSFINSSSVATFGDDPLNPIEIPFTEPFTIDYDDKRIINEASISKAFGPLDQTATDPTSILKYGRLTYERSDLLMSNDTEALDHANWMVQHYKDPVQRLNYITIRGCSISQWAQVLNLDIGSRVTVNKTQIITSNNLISNGFGESGNNYNFTGGSGIFTYDSTDVKSPAKGSFKTTTYTNYSTNELVPVNPAKKYTLSTWAKSGNLDGTSYNAGNSQYCGYTPYDIDKRLIDPLHYLHIPGATDTTLAAQLNPGATTVQLTNATGWMNGGATHQRQFTWWPYVATTGLSYPAYTYSRNTQPSSPINWWNAGGISGNTITLNSPWSGPILPIGTPVRNNTSGGTYVYALIGGGAVPNAWTFYSFTWQGNDVNGAGTGQLPYGTAYITGLWLVNWHAASDNTIRYSQFQLNENGYNNPRISIEAIVEKIDNNIDMQGKWETTLYLSNADIQNYLVLDHATLGKLDSGNKLAF